MRKSQKKKGKDLDYLKKPWPQISNWENIQSSTLNKLWREENQRNSHWDIINILKEKKRTLKSPREKWLITYKAFLGRFLSGNLASQKEVVWYSGIAHFIALHLIMVHRYCIFFPFYKPKFGANIHQASLLSPFFQHEFFT